MKLLLGLLILLSLIKGLAGESTSKAFDPANHFDPKTSKGTHERLLKDLLLKDLEKIFNEAQLDYGLGIEFAESSFFSEGYNSKLRCETTDNKKLVFQILNEDKKGEGKDGEGPGDYFYYLLHQLGFLFPHPRLQLSPSAAELETQCDQEFKFDPVIKHRGFHLHTQHPSEWVDGFFMGNTLIAMDLVWWLKRNMQNVLQIQMIRVSSKKKLSDYMKEPIGLAQSLGIRVGLSVSFSFQQQKSWKLIPLIPALLRMWDEYFLKRSLRHLDRYFEYDFLTVEKGTSEFTPTNFRRTLQWLNLTASAMNKRDKFLMSKVHVSIEQEHPTYGNFNFLPQFADFDVGVLPHTVMFYGLNDEAAPMYGRNNFFDIRDFMLKEAQNRRTWYYPETSYYVAMDIDIPLFLTDYLVARARDSRFLYVHGIEGQVNFTTGHELGYYLFDWNLALQGLRAYNGDPLAALRLLDEPLDAWEAILSYQTEHFKNKGVIALISSSNLLDELPFFHKIHERFLLRELFDNRVQLEREIDLLNEAIANWPQIEVAAIKRQEFQILMKITGLRLSHALNVRKALLHPKGSENAETFIGQARESRRQAQILMQKFLSRYNRYPESFVFERHKNPTSYSSGYGYTAANLHFWEREEEMSLRRIKNPFFMNIYSPIQLLF